MLQNTNPVFYPPNSKIDRVLTIKSHHSVSLRATIMSFIMFIIALSVLLIEHFLAEKKNVFIGAY